MLSLTAAERRSLRAKAHRLHPVVSVGHHGLTSDVLHEIDVNLLAHELIKVRVFNEDRLAREAVLARICAELGAAPVQHIGKLLVVWRPAGLPAQDERAGARDQAKKRVRAERGGGRSRRDGRLTRTPSRDVAAAPLTAAKSTPQVRRPREPTARAPARPPTGRTRRVHSPAPAPGGRRRPRGR